MEILKNLLKKNTYIDSDKVFKAFGVSPCISENMRQHVKLWDDIYKNQAPWLQSETVFDMLYNPGKALKSLNLPKVITSELSRLATFDLDITLNKGKENEKKKTTISKETKTQEKQNEYDKSIFKIIETIKDKAPQIVETLTAVGTVILKPNGNGFDVLTPFDFIPISVDNKNNLTSVIFIDKIERGKDIFIRLEFHELKDNGDYIIKNNAFLSSGRSYDLKEIPLNSIDDWAEIQEETIFYNMENPFYVVLKYPQANNIDEACGLGVSCFANSIEQFEDIDIAYTRLVDEINSSNKIVFVSQFAIDTNNHDVLRGKNSRLPNYVVGLEFGVNEETTIHEHNPQLQTEVRKSGINALLGYIGYQCGFSNGYFQFNEKTGLTTATQIEADQQRTVQTISLLRKVIENSIRKLFDITLTMSNIFDNIIPKKNIEISFYFKDITANFEEDRKRNLKLVEKNILPKWKYLVEFEGYTENEAKQMVEEANKDGGSEKQDDYGNQIEQLQKQYVEGNKRVKEETEEPDKGIHER